MAAYRVVVMARFIDDHRATYGVEPICAVLPIAPSTYFLYRAQQQDDSQRSVRARRDDDLRVKIRQVRVSLAGCFRSGLMRVCFVSKNKTT